MRTTITLDPDVDQLLRRAMRDRGATFRDTVNEAIRSGLRAHKVPRFRQKTLEDEEIMRKIARDK